MISNNTRHSLLPLLPVTRVLPNNALSFPELIILQKTNKHSYKSWACKVLNQA